jgi:hypothetical protein
LSLLLLLSGLAAAASQRFEYGPSKRSAFITLQRIKGMHEHKRKGKLGCDAYEIPGSLTSELP